MTHTTTAVHPLDDIETISTELALADLGTLDKRLEKLSRAARTGDKATKEEQALLDKARGCLNRGDSWRSDPALADNPRLQEMHLLSIKPVLFVANYSEDAIGSRDTDPLVTQVRDYAGRSGAAFAAVSAEIEAEIEELPPEEREDFLIEMGLDESALSQIIRSARELLGLITFYTTNEAEVRGWLLTGGLSASRAAGTIHTDMEKGFIKAEVIDLEILFEAGSMKKMREEGLARIEGRDYVVKDGDLITIRFKV